MILLSQWYASGRDPELLLVRRANEQSGLFSKCVYVDGSERRWTYGDFLELAARDFSGEVIVLANTDIEFDETIKKAEDAALPNRVLALTRWESPASPRMLGHLLGDHFFSGTQDSWVFVGNQVANPERLRQVPLGVVGCDQVAVAQWAAAGCEVFDPAMEVRTWHRHSEPPPDDRPSVTGVYGYPELTTLVGTGLVAWHPWPSQDGRISLEVTKTWQP